MRRRCSPHRDARGLRRLGSSGGGRATELSLLHLQRAERRLSRRPPTKCSQASPNGEYTITFEFLPDRRRRAARAARAPARRRGRLDRHHRHGRHLDGRVRQRGLDRALDRRQREAGDRRTSSPASSRRRRSRASSTRRRSPPTPSCSGTARTGSKQPPKTWDEMIARGRADRRRRHDPGAGQPLRGLHGLGHGADRVRGRHDPRRPDDGRPGAGRRPSARSRSWASSRTRRPRRRHRHLRRRTPARLASSPGAPPSCSTTRSCTRARRRTRPTSSSRWAARRYPRVDAGQAEPPAAGRDQPRASAPSRAQGPRLRGRRVPASSPTTRSPPRRGRPAADARRTSTTRRSTKALSRLRRPDQASRSSTAAPRPHDPGLHGRLAGDPARLHPPGNRSRRRTSVTTSCATRSSRPSTGRAPLMEATHGAGSGTAAARKSASATGRAPSGGSAGCCARRR